MFIGVANPLLAAATTTVGDPANPAALVQAIQDAHAAGATDLTIAPGIYDLPTRNHQDTLVFNRWHDVTIHATGVTLIFEELYHRPVFFNSCVHVTWDGGTLRFAQPAFTQGRIVAIGSDSSGKFCDWRIDPGYSSRLQPTTLFDIVDQHTRRLKIGTGDWYPMPRQPSAPGFFRFHYRAAQNPKFVVGDWLVARAIGGTSLVIHENCQACTTKNVTLQNAGFASFFEVGGAGGNQYLACTIEPGPRPAGATEDELVGCGADGLHSNATRTGPDIEDLTCRGVFLDDCIAVHGLLQQVLQSEGPRLLLESRNLHPQVGDPLRIASIHGYFAQGTIIHVEPNDAKSVWITLDRDLHVPLDPSGFTDKKKGTQADDPNECGAGYKILRCHLGDTRSRAILVKGDNGLIDSCTIEGSGMSAVSIGPEFWWREAGYSWHVVVSRNIILGCAQNNDTQPSLSIHGDGAVGNRDITVQGNIFKNCYGASILRLGGADGVKIIGNRIDHPFPLPLAGSAHVLYVMQSSKNIQLLGNVVTNPGPSAASLVQLDPSVAPANLQNNDPAGISASAPLQQ